MAILGNFWPRISLANLGSVRRGGLDNTSVLFWLASLERSNHYNFLLNFVIIILRPSLSFFAFLGPWLP
jgi:hypothetical protein